MVWWRHLSTALLVATAAAAVALVATPARVWRQPVADATYRGFDAPLISTRQLGADATLPGIIAISPEELRVIAPPDSLPTAHLFTTPLDRFQADLEATVLRTAPAGNPLAISLWNARRASGVTLVFGAPPSLPLTLSAITGGVARSSLVGGDIVRQETFAFYSPGEPFHISIMYDREQGIASFRIRGRETAPGESRILSLSGGPGDPAYRDVTSDLIPVSEGHMYRLSAYVRLVDGQDAYKLTLEWLDGNRHHLGFDGDWRSVRSLAGWTPVEVTAMAPPDARWARIFLGSGRNTHLLFASIQLQDITAGVELPVNGNFVNVAGWSLPAPPLASIITPGPLDRVFTVTRQEVPGLFEGLRNTLTVTSGAVGGDAEAVIRAYSLTLPHQRYYGVRVTDLRARLAVAVIATLGAILLLPSILGTAQRLVRAGFPTRIPLTGMSIVGASAVLTMALASVGGHPFDMSAARVWTYIGATRSIDQLYYLPNLVSLAHVWNGGPWHEAPFPYGFSLAYLFIAIGRVYRMFLAGPGPIDIHDFHLDLLLKAIFTAFALADGLLIYKLAQALYPNRRWAPWIATALWTANPAVWVSAAIWGQTHTVSAFFLLAALLATAHKRMSISYICLAAAAFSRPQMIPLALLAVALNLRRVSLGVTIRSLAQSVLVVFIALTPWLVTIGPSFPLDMAILQLRVQELGGNEPSLRAVALGAHNFWVLVTGIQGFTGGERFAVPVDARYSFLLSYGQASWILTGLSLMEGFVMTLALARRPAAWPISLAFGAVSFFVFKTGLAPTHFLLALPLLALAAPSFRPMVFAPVLWGASISLAMMSGLALSLERAPQLAPRLAPDDSVAMRWLLDLSRADPTITALALVNMGVLLAAGAATVTASRLPPLSSTSATPMKELMSETVRQP
jgi:hypothetical protein